LPWNMVWQSSYLSFVIGHESTVIGLKPSTIDSQLLIYGRNYYPVI
jgi:hypothetical protein